MMPRVLNTFAMKRSVMLTPTLLGPSLYWAAFQDM